MRIEPALNMINTPFLSLFLSVYICFQAGYYKKLVTSDNIVHNLQQQLFLLIILC